MHQQHVSKEPNQTVASILYQITPITHLPSFYRSIPQYRLEKINDELERDVLIRAIYDVKGIDMGTGLVRYKAEVDFDGRELTRGYLDKQDLDAIMKVGSRAWICYR